MAHEISSYLWLPLWINQNKFTDRQNRHRTDCMDGKRHSCLRYLLHGVRRWHLSPPRDIRFRLTRMTREEGECYHWIIAIHSNSLPLPWCKITQERGFLAKPESGGQSNPETTLWKQKRPKISEMTMTNLYTIDTGKKVPLSVKVCDRFGLSCSFCKQNVLHPLPHESDWSDEVWTGAHKSTQKETGETTLLSDWDLPKPYSEPNSKLETDKVDMSKLHLEQGQSKRGTDRGYWLINTTTHNKWRKGEKKWQTHRKDTNNELKIIQVALTKKLFLGNVFRTN